jgi:anti-anti-sigma regulatory factor
MDPDVYYVFTMLGFNIVLSSFDIMGDAIEDFRAPRAEADAARTPEAPGFGGVESVRAMEPAPRIVSGTPGMDIVWESSRDGVRVARMSGVIETTAVSLLSDELTRELAAAPRAVLFDLSEVEYISSSGWGQFARAYEATHAVALFGMGPDLNEVYVCLEFQSFLKAFTTEEEAIQAVLATRVERPAPRVATDAQVAPASPVLTEHEASNEAVDDVLGKVLPGPGKLPAPGRTPAAEPAEAPRSADLDIASATPDRNVDKDDRLRTLGWEKYGQRLKRRSDSGKLKDSGGGSIDPREEDKS